MTACRDTTPATGAIVLGLDPGFARFGWALVRLAPDGGERVLDAGAICTEPSDALILKRDDDRRRAAELARALVAIAQAHGPAVLCAEALSHVNPRRGRMPVSTTTKVGRAWGIVDALCEVLETSLVIVSPQAIKKAACGARSASKAEVERALVRRYPELGELLKAQVGYVHEHAVDAVGSVVAALHTNEIRLARRYGAAAS